MCEPTIVKAIHHEAVWVGLQRAGINQDTKKSYMLHFASEMDSLKHAKHVSSDVTLLRLAAVVTCSMENCHTTPLSSE
ncbi:hypothetical protein AOLI_G00023020 [Acnodon oligacanthus]